MNYTNRPIDLKINIANKIFIINKYILLMLIEKRENISDISHIFDRKLLLTNMFVKASVEYSDSIHDKVAVLKKKLVEITVLEKSILDILITRKEEAGEKIRFFQKINVAIKAYKTDNLTK